METVFDWQRYWWLLKYWIVKKNSSPFDLNLIKDKNTWYWWKWRISNNLLKYEPSKLVAVEPSSAIEVARENIKSDKIELNAKGQDINFENEFDYVFALCVIHHIPEYKDV